MNINELIEKKIIEEYGTLGLEAYRKFLAKEATNQIINLIDELKNNFGKPIIIGGDKIENEITKSIAETYLNDFVEQLKQKIESL